MRIAICEDNKSQQDIVLKLIRDYKSREVSGIDVYNNGETLIEAYENGESYSIIFLDVEMDEINGIKTAEIIRKYNDKTLIIIVTSILEYALEGYGVNAFDFILKPIDVSRFNQILKKAIEKKKKERDRFYAVESRNKTLFLNLIDITYIESDKKKVRIFYKDEIISNNESISEVALKLNDSGFVRISRFYLLNMNCIKELRKNDIYLTNGEILKYSKKLEQSIKKSYMNFMMGDM